MNTATLFGHVEITQPVAEHLEEKLEHALSSEPVNLSETVVWGN
jgi:hypothetical protein